MAIKKKLTECTHTLAGLREAKVLTPDSKGRKRYRVVLLTEGKGNPRDKHYYSQACIDDPVTGAAFEGKPCFLNHPSLIEDQSQPERRVQDKGGWFDNVAPDGPALWADLTINSREAGQLLECIIQDCIEYSKTHPGEDYDGLSINANGESSEVEINGEVWNQVDRITEAESVDVVTKAARGGRFVAKLEAMRKAKTTEVDADAEKKLGELVDILKSMREKITAGGDFPLQKELRRMTDNALTLAGCGVPEDEPMMTEAQYKTMKEAVKLFESKIEKNKTKNREGSKDVKDAAMKSAHSTLKGLAEQHPEAADLLNAHADMYKDKEPADKAGGDGDDEEAAVGDEATPDTTESEASKKKEKEKKEKMEKEKKESEEKDKEEKETMESLRKENFELHLQTKLTESALPASKCKLVRTLAVGKTLEEVDNIIESLSEDLEYSLRESGVHERVGAGSGKTGGSGLLANDPAFN